VADDNTPAPDYAELRRVASNFPDHIDRQGVGWSRVRHSDLLALLTLAEQAESLRGENERLRSALGRKTVDWSIAFHERDAALSEAARLRKAVEQIGRMRLFPDDVINRTTLQSAIHVARAALASPDSLEGREEGAAGRQTCGAREPISRAAPDLSAPVEGASPWRCHKCGADFTSADGKIVGGTCPHGRPTCPLVPA
jgi:hypothetical protein